jgi:hypothetical protein
VGRLHVHAIFTLDHLPCIPLNPPLASLGFTDHQVQGGQIIKNIAMSRATWYKVIIEGMVCKAE